MRCVRSAEAAGAGRERNFFSFLLIPTLATLSGIMLISKLRFVTSQQSVVKAFLKDKGRIGLIHASKETYHLLTQILSVVSHFELSYGCQVQKCFD